MKTIGVLGGFGPQATMDFEQRVHRVAQQLIPPQRNGGYPPMIVHYCRHPPVLLDADGQTRRPIQPDPRLLKAAHTLGQLRSEEHTSELQSLRHLVCRLLLEKKK